MIAKATKSYSKEEVLRLLDPIVAEWFSRFPDITPPQRYAIVHIYEGKNVLIASPTGSGKTLAAFISIISELFKMARSGDLRDSVYCVYVSPLRSLNYDIYKNLKKPLEEIQELAKLKGLDVGEIRIAIRTGDTTQSERASMLRKPPHILITTPESLAIVLCAPKFREKLKTVRWVIVDEIHELCSSKRGVHLTLSLERLQELVGRPFARIGLSATIHPLETVAEFLVGCNDDGEPRDCVIVDTRFVKAIDLKVTCPVDDLIHTPAAITTERMYKLLKKLIRTHTTTLVFTNTRSGTERVVYHLSKLKVVDGDELAAHHSSLSREIRRSVEDRLKEGKMKAVVCSTSLELGIDIGYIDLVVQIGSPKSISRCLQRVGRSGHALDKVSKGILVGMEMDDIVEDAVMVSEAYKGKLDKVYIPRNCLDVLAQHIVGMALEKKWSVKEAYKLVRRSYCYKDLPYESFKSILKYLSGWYSTLEVYKVYGKIWYDEEEGVFGRRGKLVRLIYSTNVGTIPDEVAVKVFTLDGRWVGSIEEEFLERLSPGDIFILGGKPYEFRYAIGLKAYVAPKEGVKPTVPSWFSEMLPLSFDLGEAIGEFREKMFKLVESEPKSKVVRYLMEEYKCDKKAANSIYTYFASMLSFLKMLNVHVRPNNRVILVENYVDVDGKQNIIFHCVFGRRTNDALSRAYAYALMKMLGVNVAVTVGDSSFMLTLPEKMLNDVGTLLEAVKSSNLRRILREAIKYTEMVKRRFRHCATRALMILRNYKGKEVKVSRQILNAQVLMDIVEEIENFPVLEETYREVLEDLMDVKTAEQVLREVEMSLRRFYVMPEYDLPSPFSHGLILQGLSDVVLMDDKRVLLQRLYDQVVERIRKANVTT
ncbi:MAG: ATP-dependent helicase [Candidatus Nezhaarchaeota archaeon]|nr:ATP-dependent helicase [Candidatus Nezhaarchaeota archaeon]MCX8142602.1 ATP-dependent helicase [Candidatus Nezhaarchaeota archaeon]